MAITAVMPWLMLTDVVDWDELTWGRRREGQIYSFFVFFQKIGSGVAIALSNWLIGLGGYTDQTELLPWDQVPADLKTVLRVPFLLIQGTRRARTSWILSPFLACSLVVSN